jgi:uncharacterized protein (DUF302 family)
MYGFHVRPQGGFDQVVDEVTEALKSEGFGVLSDIDVAKTFKAKLDIERRPYRILGACNPNLAHQALGAETDLGVLLPCNVCVSERDDGGTRVAAMNPAAAFELVDNPKVSPIAAEVRDRIQRVLDGI